MSYTTEEKLAFINGYKTFDGSVGEYAALHNISKTSYYTWVKEFDRSFIELPTSLFNEPNNTSTAKSELYLLINDIKIIVDNNYDESLLLNIIRSLKKI